LGLKKLILTVVVLAALGAPVAWLVVRRSAPPEVPFARAIRETLVSSLVTNGKVEPLEWVAVRAETEGAVARVVVEKGLPVAPGAVLVELDSSAARGELVAAESRLAEAQARLQVFELGGPAAELAEIDNGLARARLELETARRDLASLGRLAEKNAAARIEVTAAEDRQRQAQAQIRALDNKRAALVSPAGRQAAESRVREAESSVALSRRRIEQTVIRSPIHGVVYLLEARRGSYLRPGDLVAEVGQVDRLRVVVYVDEPELGRIERGMPVSITWDAQPGRRWEGKVEKLPSRIIALGTRQVGEVSCAVANPGRQLPAGANINAEIRTRVVENAVTIPKETLRRQGASTGVFVLSSDRVSWRTLGLGSTSVTRAQVVEGLEEGAAVALPTEIPLRNGDRVRAVFPQQ